MNNRLYKLLLKCNWNLVGLNYLVAKCLDKYLSITQILEVENKRFIENS